jgi:CBS-domain-containing membrane protein
LPDARSRLFLIEDGRPLTDAASLLADTTRHMVVVCNRTGTMVGVVTRTDIRASDPTLSRLRLHDALR